MLPEIGVLALLASLIASLCLMCVPSVGLRAGRATWMQSAETYVFLQWGWGAVAFLILVSCFLTNDFSVWYVRMNSSLALPWFYKACAVWGGHEGSMLLWLCLLQTWTLAVRLLGQSLPAGMRIKILAVLGGLSAAFLLFILFSSNPFIRVFQDLSTSGRDLNPLLQDPGFLFHPPMLYMGYVGFAVPFAVAIATLWSAKWDEAVMRWTRPWILAAWCCLTLGVTLGSWWAYRELGWGGYWFWDPVENASLMPWIGGTALIHAWFVAQKRQALIAWVLLLSITVFSFSLVGTFLVRSGVLTSVHAFAVDPARGLFILGMLGGIVGSSLLLFAQRAKSVMTEAPIPLISREMLLLLNNVLLVAFLMTVFLGTIYPLLVEGLGGEKLSVGAPYFNFVLVPLAIPFLLLMGFSWTVRWGANTWRTIQQESIFSALLSVLAGGVGYWIGMRSGACILGVIFGVWVLVTTIQNIWQRGIRQQLTLKHLTFWGGRVAHVGIAATTLGIAISAGLGEQLDDVLSMRSSLSFAGYQFYFQQLSPVLGPNYHGVRAHLRVKGPHTDTMIFPEKRIYDVGHVAMTDAAIDVTPVRDLYVALGEAVSEDAWSVRLYYRPGVRLIWGGGCLMFLGGSLSMVGAWLKRRK